MYIWAYSVVWLDPNNCYEQTDLTGIIFASTWSEAMNKLVEAYGENDLFEIKRLVAISDEGPTFELPRSIIDALEEHVNAI